jgi:L-ascorbate metabolism protein UlaG (beta-lactamase superfamily)
MKNRLVLFILQFLLSACTVTRYKGQVSDHFDGQRFFNPLGQEAKGLWQVLKWQLSFSKTEWPKWVENEVQPRVIQEYSGDQVALTFINHSSVLIQTKEITILTDPIWSDRTSPVTWAGPKRVRAPAVHLDQLPKIDLVLVSHNHYDHLDLPSLKKLAETQDPLFLVPLGDGEILKSVGIKKFQEMDWWQTYTTDGNDKIHFTPCQHWSARGVFDRYASLWGSFVIESASRKIYFAGDTGYAKHFQDVNERMGAMDIGLLPIGAFEPRWIMKDQHMNPEEAVQAHLDLKSKMSFGVHFGTFQLTDEGIDQPLIELKAALEKHQVNATDFIAPVFGQTYFVD